MEKDELVNGSSLTHGEKDHRGACIVDEASVVVMKVSHTSWSAPRPMGS